MFRLFSKSNRAATRPDPAAENPGALHGAAAADSPAPAAAAPFDAPEPPEPAKPPTHGREDGHDDHRYRVPRDLEVTPTNLRRILVIGSCLAGGLPDYIARAHAGCPADYVLFNNLSELPQSPPLPVESYDFQLVQIPLRSVLVDWLYFRPPYDEPDAWARILADAQERIGRLLEAALRWNAAHGLLTFVSNFMLPQQNAHGRLLPRYDLRNPVYMVEQLNKVLAEEVARCANAFILDLDQVAATFGRKYIQDDGLWQTNHGSVVSDLDFPLDQARIAPIGAVSHQYTLRGYEFVESLWAETVALYRTVRQIDAVKLVIVDLDDTLWRGVAAEMEDHPPEMIEGWPLGLAEALCMLKRRGVVLAIVSKNHESRIGELWDPIFQGRLSLADFAVKRINWEPKAENVEAVIREVNVLPRSVVFIDDNPVERAAVGAALPGIRVLGANQYVLRRILLWAPEMQVPLVTDESARRTMLVQANSAREVSRKRLSRAEFLATLDLKVHATAIDDVVHKSFPRAFELVNKTNQFNTTGKRWTQEEFLAGFTAGMRAYAFEVEDRFSRHGLVGVVIASPGRIEQVVMSCRVVGLDVEIAMVGEAVWRLAQEGARRVATRLVDTAANLLSRDLFERCGFTAAGDGEWIGTPDGVPALPPHIGGLDRPAAPVAAVSLHEDAVLRDA